MPFHIPQTVRRNKKRSNEQSTLVPTKTANVTKQIYVLQEEVRRPHKAFVSLSNQQIVVEASKPAEKPNLGGSGRTVTQMIRGPPLRRAVASVLRVRLIWTPIIQDSRQHHVLKSHRGIPSPMI